MPWGDALGEKECCRLGDTSAGHLLPAYVHQSVEECSGCYHHTLCPQLGTPDGAHACHVPLVGGCPGIAGLHIRVGEHCCGLLFVDYQLHHLVLPDVQVVGIVEHGAPFPDEFLPVALSPWRPYGRPFRAVQHPELYRRGIRYEPHLSSQCVYLSDNLAFSYSADSRIARHLGYFVHVHRHQTGLCAYPGSCRSSLAACVAATDDNDIVV